MRELTEIEKRNVLRKVEWVRIRYDLEERYKADWPQELSEEVVKFCKKYAGKWTYVYVWCIDFWVCEDDNVPIYPDYFQYAGDVSVEIWATSFTTGSKQKFTVAKNRVEDLGRTHPAWYFDYTTLKEL